MFRSLRVKRQPIKVATEPGALSAEQLSRDPTIPVAIRQINDLPGNAKKRVYRSLFPPRLLTRFGLDPITWISQNGDQMIRLKAEHDTGKMNLTVRRGSDPSGDFICIELADNSFNGIDLNLILLNDPDSPYFRTDFNQYDQPTYFGTTSRNLPEELRSMQAGLAPGQVRNSLGASKLVLAQIDGFLATLGHRAYFLEPLTYVSAWVFERRGFAYVRGHKLMDDIHQGFQPEGRLYHALDGSTPFRQPNQWSTVRGRAWAIHDGVLEVIGEKWDGLRMVKQVGRHAHVETFPGAKY